MRVICLVPSITETLIACQVNLVGRSRFCIHPAEAVKEIKKVGGTKDIDWSKTTALQPDLVILDKEENTLEMAQSCPYEFIALHITDVRSVSIELARLANRLGNGALDQIARRWRIVSETPGKMRNVSDIPGVIEWWRRPDTSDKPKKFEYLIWKDPWMAIGENTFIQSMLDHLGLTQSRNHHAEKYPVIDLNTLDVQNTLLLFSSEPFPFGKHRSTLLALGFDCALIDGEKFSWYGIRSLAFLEEQFCN